MAKTAIADIIVPSVFAPYALERTATLSEVIQSGIVAGDPEFDRLASGPGKTVNLPYWKDLTGTSEVLSDSGSLTLDKITTGQDIAAVNNRGKAWGSNILAKLLAGDDPMRQIADLFGGVLGAGSADELAQDAGRPVRQQRRGAAHHAPGEHLLGCGLRLDHRRHAVARRHVCGCHGEAGRRGPETGGRGHAQRRRGVAAQGCTELSEPL